MDKPLKWGILGAATIARKCVIPALLASRKSCIKVLGSRNPKLHEDFCRKHDIYSVVADYNAVLADPDVAAVYIPLPNHLHHQWTIKALTAGKHVLCEKPIACNAGEAEEMFAAARAKGKLLMEGFMYRFHPRSIHLQRMVTEGQIGTLKLVRSSFCFRMDTDVLKAGVNFRLRPEAGGGALMDVGCYGISAARWFFGKEPISVKAQADYHPNGVDLHLAAILQFAGGGLAVVEASFVSALQQTYALIGDQAAIELPHDAFIPWSKDTTYHIRDADQDDGQIISAGAADEYRKMIDHFVDAIGGKTVLDDFYDDSIANMRVLDAVGKAAKSDKTVYLRGDDADEP